MAWKGGVARLQSDAVDAPKIGTLAMVPATDRPDLLAQPVTLALAAHRVPDVYVAESDDAFGVMVIGFGFPVVPKGQARLRVQVSAALEREHLEKALEAFGKL